MKQLPGSGASRYRIVGGRDAGKGRQMNRNTRLTTTTALFFALAGCGGGETGFKVADPDNEQVSGEALLEITRAALEWTDLPVGISTSEVFKITSSGETDLNLYEVAIVSSAEGQFYMEEAEDIELAPGASREFLVVCTLAAEAEAVGEVRIKSNDPDQLDLRVTLTAHPASGDSGGSDTGGSDTGGSDTGGADSGA